MEKTNVHVMFDWLFGEDMDIEDVGEALAMGVLDGEDDYCDATGFAFDGSGYYDEEGIWHDPEVEE